MSCESQASISERGHLETLFSFQPGPTFLLGAAGPRYTEWFTGHLPHWPHPQVPEQEMASTCCAFLGLWPSGSEQDSFWYTQPPLHRAALFHLTNSCWSFKVQFKYYLCYKVTQISHRGRWSNFPLYFVNSSSLTHCFLEVACIYVSDYFIQLVNFSSTDVLQVGACQPKATDDAHVLVHTKSLQ